LKAVFQNVQTFIYHLNVEWTYLLFGVIGSIGSSRPVIAVVSLSLSWPEHYVPHHAFDCVVLVDRVDNGKPHGFAGDLVDIEGRQRRPFWFTCPATSISRKLCTFNRRSAASTSLARSALSAPQPPLLASSFSLGIFRPDIESRVTCRHGLWLGQGGNDTGDIGFGEPPFVVTPDSRMVGLPEFVEGFVRNQSRRARSLTSRRAATVRRLYRRYR
jgi:hypothetical protein